MTKQECLKLVFGYDAFREGQEALIDQLLAGGDALGIMPTGAGKSVCYQVPALLREGVALIVSPLISLMKDQVAALKAAGVPAAYINSSLTPAQQREALRRAGLGWYRMVYVAPERLDVPEFQAFAQNASISLIAVDEAHCVSQWGQDFRPSYLKIADFIKHLPVRPPVGAFTATATPQVKEDMVRMLRLEKPLTVVTGFDRPNLRFANMKPTDKFAALMEIVRKHAGESGIVYCATRKTVEEVCERLKAEGVSATRYHAGLDDAERMRNQDDFQFDRCSVIVATNAFGMGIDKSDVSFVAHYNMPRCLENYYQEAGRAGRDGSPADCVLLYGGQDVMTARWML
ncbi:MAG TPA: RecQ family ATP-dependent DNA helicase, partial [Candidatus Limiplasma sp.]|nr:RecQ family ATP-dependent DNA helicase [Candidatus Limiplasma sp.]